MTYSLNIKIWHLKGIDIIPKSVKIYKAEGAKIRYKIKSKLT